MVCVMLCVMICVMIRAMVCVMDCVMVITKLLVLSFKGIFKYRLPKYALRFSLCIPRKQPLFYEGIQNK